MVKVDINEVIRNIPYKNIERLRGIITRALIYPWTCEEYDTILCPLIDRDLVTIKDGFFVCNECRKKLKTYRAIFYHILNSHYDLVNMIAYTYIYRKYKWWGLV